MHRIILYAVGGMVAGGAVSVLIVNVFGVTETLTKFLIGIVCVSGFAAIALGVYLILVDR